MQALSYGFPLRLNECRIPLRLRQSSNAWLVILSSKIDMEDDPLGIPDIQACIL